VQLWDSGTWAPQSETPPSRDLDAGHLKMVLAGKRLKGGWALIRLRDRDEGRRRTPRHNWLLIKERDGEARDGDPDALLSETTSVKTGSTLEEIADRSRKVWQSNRAPDDQPQAAAKPAKRSAAKRTGAKRAPAKRAKAARPAKRKPARISKRKARKR